MSTKIEWTEETWPVVAGCTPVSEGCKNCYAARFACGRLKNHSRYKGLATGGKWTGEVRCNADVLDQPLHWHKPRQVFVASMGDLFHGEVPLEFIEAVFGIMARNQQHNYQVLTKRPRRMAKFMAHRRFMDNVWLGTSVENQKAADERMPHLVKCSPARLFLSMEPLLGPVDLAVDIGHGVGDHGLDRLDGVIVGGETGPKARPMHPDWVRSIRDQCVAAGVPFFFKGWGNNYPFYDRDVDDPDWQSIPKESGTVTRINLAGGQGFHGDRVVYFKRMEKKKAGRLLDGREWNELPWR